jgi:hypothetical protein
MLENVVGLPLNEAISEIKKTYINVRVLREGHINIMTADYVYNRVTIHVDDNDKVIRAELLG